jgi:hypothetical protein
MSGCSLNSALILTYIPIEPNQPRQGPAFADAYEASSLAAENNSAQKTLMDRFKDVQLPPVGAGCVWGGGFREEFRAERRGRQGG